MSVLRKVDVPDSCTNCTYLTWGYDEGYDKCAVHGFGVYWENKTKQVCNDHERSFLMDPRCKVRQGKEQL
jgi:hypothetical protein